MEIVTGYPLKVMTLPVDWCNKNRSYFALVYLEDLVMDNFKIDLIKLRYLSKAIIWPPIDVVMHKDHYYVMDGHHRALVAELRHLVGIAANVQPAE